MSGSRTTEAERCFEDAKDDKEEAGVREGGTHVSNGFGRPDIRSPTQEVRGSSDSDEPSRDPH